jgi:hypothetical protein
VERSDTKRSFTNGGNWGISRPLLPSRPRSTVTGTRRKPHPTITQVPDAWLNRPTLSRFLGFPLRSNFSLRWDGKGDRQVLPSLHACSRGAPSGRMKLRHTPHKRLEVGVWELLLGHGHMTRLRGRSEIIGIPCHGMSIPAGDGRGDDLRPLIAEADACAASALCGRSVVRPYFAMVRCMRPESPSRRLATPVPTWPTRWRRHGLQPPRGKRGGGPAIKLVHEEAPLQGHGSCQGTTASRRGHGPLDKAMSRSSA